MVGEAFSATCGLNIDNPGPKAVANNCSILGPDVLAPFKGLLFSANVTGGGQGLPEISGLDGDHSGDRNPMSSGGGGPSHVDMLNARNAMSKPDAGIKP